MRSAQSLDRPLVEQNVEIALGAVNRAYVLQQGHIVLQGSAAEMASNPQVREAYLGV